MKVRVKETIELTEKDPPMMKDILKYRGQIIEVERQDETLYLQKGDCWAWRKEWLDFLPEDKVQATEAEYGAVNKTIIAWKALAADPRLKKKDIPDLLPDTYQKCWLCVPWLNINAKCPDCPLSGEDFRCETKGQPYNVWRFSEGTERQIAALQLIKQCEDWREAHPLKPEKPELVIELGHVYRIEGRYYNLIAVADGYALASLRNGYTWIGWSDTIKGAFGWALDRAEHIGPASEVVEVKDATK